MSNFISDFFDSVGETLTDAWHAVEANPVGVLVTIGGAMYGLPPIYAGALGGAAGTAAAGGSTDQIIKGALTGGALAYIGGEASSAAGGGLAGAAAGGAATGAAITAINGGKLSSNIWNGLVIGTTVGGIQQIMTTQEAIDSIPKDVMAAANASADPMGTLIEKMGWTPGNGAISAAGQAVNDYQVQQREANMTAAEQEYAKTRTNINMNDAYNNPDIEKYVYESQMANDPAQALAEKLGYSKAQLTADPTITDAMNKVLIDPAVNNYNPNQVSQAAQQLVNTGYLNNAEATLLSDSGYTAQDVQDLVKAGYAAGDLVDMASTGVPASTLKSLANTQFSEYSINNMLTSGNVSANEIAQASNLVNSGKLNVTTAESLLNHGVNSYDLPNIANSGKAEQFAKLLDSGVSRSNAQYMLDKNVDLSKASQMIDSGKLTGQQINDSFGNNTYNKTISDINSYTGPVTPTTTTPTTTPTGPTAPVDPYSNFAETQKFDFKTGDINQLADQYGDQYAKDLASQRIPSSQAANYNARLPGLLSEADKNINLDKYLASSPDVATLEKNLGWSSNQFTNEAAQELMDNYRADQQALARYQQTQTQLAQADTGTVTDTGTPAFRVDVGGVPAMQGQGTPIQEYRTPGTDLATPQQVDSGQATWNAAANSWEVPTPTAPVVPPVTTPTTTTEQPYVPVTSVITPPVTTPVTQPTPQPTQPVTAPVQPSGPTLTYSNTVSGNNTTYKVDHYSDGTIKYTDTSNGGTGNTADEATKNGTITVPVSPTTGGTGGTGTGVGTGTGTGGTGTVTQPVEPPLTPPKQEVIPPDSSKVTPVETTTTTDTTTPTDTTTGGTTDQPYIPVTDVIPKPTPQTTEEGAYPWHWGTVPTVKTNLGLNPGWIRAVPHYQTTSPVQAQYYWGQHPFQAGTTFDPNLANTLPNAPAVPFGVKEAPRSATPEEILQAMSNYTSLLAPKVAGPVAP